jgi:hypothetical protein
VHRPHEPSNFARPWTVNGFQPKNFAKKIQYPTRFGEFNGLVRTTVLQFELMMGVRSRSRKKLADFASSGKQGSPAIFIYGCFCGV